MSEAPKLRVIKGGDIHKIFCFTNPRPEHYIPRILSRNNLPDPTSKIQTLRGTLLYWKDGDHVILYSESEGDVEKEIGGSGFGEHVTTRYHLEGVLGGAPVELLTEKTSRRSRPAPGSYGRKTTQTERIDNFPYWFIVNPKKRPRSS